MGKLNFPENFFSTLKVLNNITELSFSEFYFNNKTFLLKFTKPDFRRIK